MKQHRFGGAWTSDKLEVLRQYLPFYARALKRFDLVYIDSFAGTGRCHIKVDGAMSEIDGSATIALDCVPAFGRYFFIESSPSNAAELERLITSHPNGDRAIVCQGMAANVLPSILRSVNWKGSRGVLFLDPFGLQVTWQLLEQIRATGALDVLFLVSLSGLFRQAAIRSDRIDPAKEASLNAFYGTNDWRAALYTQEQGGLFDGPTFSRESGWHQILQLTTARLSSLFPHVSEPMVLQLDRRNVPLFALYFAVSNPSKAAIALAARVSQGILKQR